MLSRIERPEAGPFIDASALFPEPVYAFVTLKGACGTDESALIHFLEERGCFCTNVHRVEQVHSGMVVDADCAPCRADGILCDRPGEAVRVVTADCVPVLLSTKDGQRIAAVHAGWKGTLARIVEAAVGRLRTGNSSGVSAYIGPAIGACCYAVDKERYDVFRRAFPGWVGDGGGRPVLDLSALNAHMLESAGIGPSDIHVENRCTACSIGLCCSYRRDGEAAGRMAAVIGRKR